MNTILLNEVIDILNEINEEYISSEDSNSKLLEQAILKLEHLRYEEQSSDKTKKVLSILGRFLENIPEIQELLQMLAEL